jgi:hypothetical protein
MTTELFKVINYNLDTDHMTGTEQVGEITLHFIEQDVQVTNAIWFDEDGNHYFCWVSDELDEDGDAIVEDGLLSDFTDYIAPETEEEIKAITSELEEQPSYQTDVTLTLNEGSHSVLWLCTDNRMWLTDNSTGKQEELTNEDYHHMISKFAPQLIKQCPKCLTNELDLDEEMNALSRQTNTPICSECGQAEAMEEMGL